MTEEKPPTITALLRFAIRGICFWEALSVALFLTLSVPAETTAASDSGKPTILYDTDIGPDCDDAGTLAVLHALADLDECHILGMAATVSSPWAAPCLDAINTYYGHPDLPVGTLKADGFLATSRYSKQVTTEFPNDLKNGSAAPNAVVLYRELLSGQPDGSVTVVAVGPMRNMRDLLESSGDEHSPLGGRDLVAAKVARLVVMGGNFPRGGAEWNLKQDTQSAHIVADEWPGQIIFSGGEVGNSIQTGASLSEATPPENPVRRAYELFVGAGKSRSSWDQTAMLYAIRSDPGLFRLSAPGRVEVDPNTGVSTFSPDESGQHHYLIKEATDDVIGSEIDELMIQPPKDHASRSAE